MREVGHRPSPGRASDVVPVNGGDTLPLPGAPSAAELPFVDRNVDPFSLGPRAAFSSEIGGETVELRVCAAGHGVTLARPSGDAPPGKRLVRFDPQTGEPLSSARWAELPAGPGDEAEGEEGTQP